MCTLELNEEVQADCLQNARQIYPVDTEWYQEKCIRNVDHNKSLKPQKLYGNRLIGLNSQAENKILKLNVTENFHTFLLMSLQMRFV